MDKAEAIFHQLLEVDGFDKRRDLAREACGADNALREKVERFLLLHEDAECRFPSEPAGHRAESIPTLLDESVLTEGPGTRIGRYHLLEKLGQGGFGSVWAAEQKEPVRRRVALKIIKLGMDTQQVVARFEAERQALALMDHPNIAKVLDAGATDSGRPYFVMELVKGIAITKYCDHEKLSARARLELFIKVCHAVQHAHQKGIIHRDIKPSNVMVTLHDGIPVPKVIDFGIAKATEQELTEKTIYTHYGQFIGTPAYMSPEQAEMSGLDIDTRSDIYSLGVLLYELLTGQTPFDSTELMQSSYEEMRRIICQREPQRPSTKVGRLENNHQTAAARQRSSDITGLITLLRGDLDWVIMKCLEKDRSRRYETANGLALDVKRHLSDETVAARPPNAVYKFQKAWRRNKVAFTSALVVGIIILLALAFSTGSFLRERDARISEASQRKKAETSQLLAEKNAEKAQQSAESLRRALYTADMGLALQAVEQNDVGQARMHLDRHRPQSGQDDIRGFEWRYLWGRSRSQEETILGQYRGRFGGLAISPDGRLVANIDRDTIFVRSLPEGTLVKMLNDVAGPVTRFSPNGRHLLAEHSDGSIRRWNTGNWKEATRLEGLARPFTFASKNNILVAWAGDHLAVWNTATWTPMNKLPGKTELNMFEGQSLALSADGDIAFLGGDHGEIRSWHLGENRELEALDTGIRHTIPCLAVSSRGVLAAAHWSGQVTLWDIGSRQRLDLLHDHRSWVGTVAFSSDGSVLATASADRTLAIYDVQEDGSATFRKRLLGHEGEIWAMALSPDARWLCSGSDYDGTLRFWNVGGPPVAPQGNQISIPLEFTRSGRSLIGWSENGSLLELEIATGIAAPLAGMPAPLPVYIGAEVWPSDSYDPLKNRVSRRKWAAVATAEGLAIWNLQRGKMEKSISETNIYKQGFTFSDDGSLLAIASKKMGIRLWQTNDWSWKQLIPEFEFEEPPDLCFSRDNKYLAVTASPSAIIHANNILIDLVSEKAEMELDTKGERTMARTFSPDGEYFAVGVGHNRIHLWNIPRKEKLSHILDGHLAGVRGLSFSPNSRTLVSCGDNRVKLWNVETGQEFFTLHQAKGETAWPVFSADGTCLVTATSVPSLHLWKAPSWEEIAAAESANLNGQSPPALAPPSE